MVRSTSRRTRVKRKSGRPASGRDRTAGSRAPTPKTSARERKWVYRFGKGKAEGRADMRTLLGGKGAGLAEMASLGLPVPPGFTITTEVCTYYYSHGTSYPPELREKVTDGLAG